MSDETGPGANQPANPDGFAAGAAAGLAPAEGAISRSRREADAGRLRLSPEGAEAMLARLRKLRARADKLLGNAAELDQPLRFGDNWVGEIMNARFRGAADGRDHSVGAVLARYCAVLDDVEATVRAAARRYDDAEGELADTFRLLGEEGGR